MWRFGFPFLLVALLAAQGPPPVFRAGTRLVEVTVTVLDKKGNAVTGLESGDFNVLDDGKPRTISLFRFDGASTAAAPGKSPAAALPPGVFTNGVTTTGGETPRNITALVLDSLNTPPLQSTVARAQALRYLRTLAPESRVAIFVMGTQLRILHDFTDDAAALRAKLEKATLGMPTAFVTDYTRSVLEAEAFVSIFAGSPAMEADAADMAKRMLDRESIANSQSRRFRMEQSLAALAALGRHLAGIPGRKNLVWIGSGFLYAVGQRDRGHGRARQRRKVRRPRPPHCAATRATGRHPLHRRFERHRSPSRPGCRIPYSAASPQSRTL